MSSSNTKQTYYPLIHSCALLLLTFNQLWGADVVYRDCSLGFTSKHRGWERVCKQLSILYELLLICQLCGYIEMWVSSRELRHCSSADSIHTHRQMNIIHAYCLVFFMIIRRTRCCQGYGFQTLLLPTKIRLCLGSNWIFFTSFKSYHYHIFFLLTIRIFCSFFDANIFYPFSQPPV